MKSLIILIIVIMAINYMIRWYKILTVAQWIRLIIVTNYTKLKKLREFYRLYIKWCKVYDHKLKEILNKKASE